MASFDDAGAGAPHGTSSSTAPSPSYAYPFSVAPMMGVTDRHWRWMARQMSRKTLLYTEMVVDNALNHNAHNLGGTQFLGHDACEAPVAVQLGGNDAKALGDAAALCVDYFGDSCVEINLNCGCPSNVVAARNEFGARLMLDPEKVRRRAGQESEIPNFKGSYLGRFPLVSGDFWTSDHLSERSRSVDVFP